MTRETFDEQLKALEQDEGTRDEEAAMIARLMDRYRPMPAELYQYKRGVAIENPEMKEIFFNNLELTHGRDVSFVKKTIFLTAKPQDIPRLRRIRSRIYSRFSDEASYDWRTISALITWLRWQDQK